MELSNRKQLHHTWVIYQFHVSGTCMYSLTSTEHSAQETSHLTPQRKSMSPLHSFAEHGHSVDMQQNLFRAGMWHYRIIYQTTGQKIDLQRAEGWWCEKKGLITWLWTSSPLVRAWQWRGTPFWFCLLFHNEYVVTILLLLVYQINMVAGLRLYLKPASSQTSSRGRNCYLASWPSRRPAEQYDHIKNGYFSVAQKTLRQCALRCRICTVRDRRREETRWVNLFSSLLQAEFWFFDRLCTQSNNRFVLICVAHLHCCLPISKWLVLSRRCFC